MKIMKFLAPVLLSLVLLYFGITTLESCAKTQLEPQEAPKYLERSVFPIYINLGNDTSLFRATSVKLNGTAYIPTCGLPPEYEAPIWGVEVYQIAGATNAVIQPNTAAPLITNLSIGVYKFVGHAYQSGFRLCDSTYVNDNAYDTITVTIRKNRKK